MYICKHCGKIFEDDAVVEIRDDPSPSGVGLPSGYYTYYECPHCGSDDIEEATECVICGDWFAYDGDEICEECYCHIANSLDRVRSDMGLTDEQFAKVVRMIY